MSLELSGYGVSNATLHVPRWGVPMASVVMIEDPPLTIGSIVTLTIGDLTMVGTLQPGASFGGTSSYTFVGGGGGWDKPIPARSYSDTNQIPTSRVLTDLGTAANEVRIRGVLFPPLLTGADTSLGVTWTRPAGLARDALDALSPHNASAPNIGGQWWVAADGITRVGPRAATSCAPASMTIGHYDPDMRRATVTLSDDAIAQLFPGATVTAAWVDGAPASTLLVGSMTVRAEPGSIEVDIFGEKGAAELLADLVAALTAYTRWHVAYPCAVSSLGSAGVNVDPLNALAAALPGLPGLPQWPGVPGMTATLQKGAPVLVSFMGGSPGGAAITGYGPGVNAQALAFAAAALTMNGPTLLGGSGGGLALLLASPSLLSWVSAVSAALAALGHPVTAPTGFTSSTTKAVP